MKSKRKAKFLILPLIVLLASNAYGTFQVPEYLVIGTDTFSIEEYPLNAKIEQDSNLLPTAQAVNADGNITICVSSGCWRGYIGTWTIVNDSLYLINLVPSCDLEKDEENPLAIEKLFENSISSRGVFASWVNDTLNARCITAPCDNADSQYIISNGVVTNKPGTANSTRPEQHPDFQKPLKNRADSETGTIDSDNQYQYVLYLLIGGIILVILIINKRIGKRKSKP